MVQVFFSSGEDAACAVRAYGKTGNREVVGEAAWPKAASVSAGHYRPVRSHLEAWGCSTHPLLLHFVHPAEALDGAIALNERPIADDVLTAVPIPDYGKVEAIPLLTVCRLGARPLDCQHASHTHFY